MELEFICERCGGTAIHEVCQNAVTLQLVSVDEDGDYIYAGPVEVVQSDVSHYECSGCGLEITADSADGYGLAEALMKRKEDQNER
jgi:hypothetical protein